MKKILFGGLLALSALLVSCEKSQLPEPQAGDASITVRIDNPTRANPNTILDEEQMQKGENALRSFTVYVFNYSTGRLEAKAEGDLETASARIENLSSATPKRIVLTANTPVSVQVGGSYSDFANQLMDLDDEPISYPLLTANNSKGFAMFGEKGPVSLEEGENTETVEIEHLVSKVTLANITVKIETDPEAEGYQGYSEADLANFSVTGVTMQKVVGQADFMGNNSGVLYGGIAGDGLASTYQKEYLIDRGWEKVFDNNETKEFGNFFYVMPNDGGQNGDYTMMTVVAKYYDNVVYYPVVINRSKVDDKYVGKIENNTWYNLDLTIKDLLGSPGPELPKGEASLEVTVTVKDWTPAPTQYEEW